MIVVDSKKQYVRVGKRYKDMVNVYSHVPPFDELSLKRHDDFVFGLIEMVMIGFPNGHGLIIGFDDVDFDVVVINGHSSHTVPRREKKYNVDSLIHDHSDNSWYMYVDGVGGHAMTQKEVEEFMKKTYFMARTQEAD